LKNHTKIYLKHFGYDPEDFIACEVCGRKAVDIHHINARGMGGTKEKDTIENLQALCRMCHLVMGDSKVHMDRLIEAHKNTLDNHKVKYN
jgi:5-methylcytosine-specific restriction endonuclease McrA